MNSTDRRRLSKFWRKRFGPAAARLSARGASLLDEQASGSSWSEPAADVPELTELSPGDLEAQLIARLEAQDLAELAELIPDLMRLAAQLRPSLESEDELDPYVYVMH